MALSTELFDLVKRLSTVEKRYFILNTQLQKGEKSYLSLYKELEMMEEYDEEALKAALDNLGLNTANLPAAKNQLMKMILKSLRSFNENEKPEQTISSMLLEADILKRKGLYASSLKLLEKAKATARHYELHYQIFEILNRQVNQSIDMLHKNPSKDINALFEEIENLTQTVQTETEMRLLANKLLWVLTSLPLKRPSTVALVNEIEQKLTQKGINEDDSFFARTYYLQAKGFINYVKGDFVSANTIHQKILELWERYPHIRDSNRVMYKGYIYNYLVNCNRLGDYHEFEQWLNKLSTVDDMNYDEEATSFINRYKIQQLYLLNTRQFEKALELVSIIEVGLQRYKPKITKSSEMTFRFIVFITLFINEKFVAALDWLDTMTLDNKFKGKADLIALVRIMQLVVHHELGHARFLENMHNTVYRRLKKEQQLHEFERTILNSIKQLEQAKNNKLLKMQTYTELHEKLKAIGEKYGYNNITGLEEITCWAESKLVNRRFSDVLRENKLN